MLAPTANVDVETRALRAGRRSHGVGWTIGCAVLLAMTIAASLALGARPVAVSVVIDSLLGREAGAEGVIVLQSRLPRTLAGLACGAALAVAGALIQALTRNPLADPGILGINAGAGLAVTLGVLLGIADGPLAIAGYGFGGALATTLLVYAVGARGPARADPMRFVLAGLAIGAVMNGLASALTLLNPGVFDRMRLWSAGSLDIRDLRLALVSLPLILAGVLAALAIARPLNALALGEDIAAALGARPAATQAATILTVALLCGVATAMTGPIGFVGLMIPHVARWVTGADLRRILPVSLIAGPILLLVSDIVGRMIAPGELRVSIVTAFVGAPALIWLARRRTATL